MDSTSRGNRHRGPLNRDRILEAAVRLIDEEGLAAVTMRRLANDLAVGTMSLYTYVPKRKCSSRASWGSSSPRSASPSSIPPTR